MASPAGADLPEGVRPGGRFDRWRPATPAYVVADVDGTLLGDAPEATDEVVAALARARAAGLRVGFATGRMPGAVRPLWERTRIDGPHVLHNGALVRAEGATVASYPLGDEEVERLLDLCARLDLYAELYLDEGYLVTDRREEAAVHWWMLHEEPRGLTSDRGGEEVVKATVLLFGADGGDVVGTLRSLGLAAGVATSPLAPDVRFVNVTRRDVDKGVALERAAAHVGVGLERVVAIGDGWNDLPMLAVAGTAIAMGQAPEDVRAAAHLVVPDVSADGVVHALDAAVAWASTRGWRGGSEPTP